MGVTGLWTVLQPCARPIKLETLNKKRLAVDASIWIYQFLKAVRDKEGNALRNSHVVGFFRRICKLLFFGIKPVFVFDGGAPILKRQTISGRKARREGRREDAVRTAGKLLALQMKKRAEEDERKRKEEQDRPRAVDDEEAVPENLVYVDELQMTEKERTQSRKFKKQDAYHLPELNMSISEMGAPNDPRIMSTEELEEYARQFQDGEDVSVYDFSKIDFDGPFFTSLPPSDRYNILNAARLRSRLRMGYSKEQLDVMFPDRMAFSKFQVERVRERNELTQRLMNINGMNGENYVGVDGVGRIAGERGKEYVLVKNDSVEGGWALGVVSSAADGGREKPIDVDHVEQPTNIDDEEEEDDFEDIPIEGLNRLPKPTAESSVRGNNWSQTIEARRKLYLDRQKAAGVDQPARVASPEEGDESLFIPEESTPTGIQAEIEELFEGTPTQEEDDELKRAIAMSLEVDDPEEDVAEKIFSANHAAMLNGPRIDEPLQFNQRNAKAGRAFAHVTNARANAAAAPRPSQMDEGDLGLEAVLTRSRKPQITQSDQKSASTPQSSRGPSTAEHPRPPLVPQAENHGFDGPLPFESVTLGKSIFTKRKRRPIPEEGGGFEKVADEKPPQVLPPWFSGDVSSTFATGKKSVEEEPAVQVPEEREEVLVPSLVRRPSREVIDLDEHDGATKEPIEVLSSDDEAANMIRDNEQEMVDIDDLPKPKPPVIEDSPAEAPQEAVVDENKESTPAKAIESAANTEWDESDIEVDSADNLPAQSPNKAESRSTKSKSPSVEFEDVAMQALPSEVVNAHSEALQIPFTIAEQESFDLAPTEAVPELDFDDDEFSDPEDEELMRQLATEAEEHARFAASLANKPQAQSAEDYERELRQLRNQQKKDRRDADEVSHIMITECQQLLQLFGLPYITAPMEAEAQCAELVRLELVDGIVTDDSDIFLFGGTRVYKNMFNQAKYVECYLSSDLVKEYSLTRDKIIQIAHLLGSDYTEGLVNVGPVTALEILSEFGDLEGFRDWWEQVQRGVKVSSDDAVPFRRKFKRNSAKIFLPVGFPDKRVDEAYLHPEVDSDPSPFAWGVPDLDGLRRFLMATIGWTQERADEILVPVIRDMNRRENEGTQANITRFFEGTVGAGARQTASTEGSFAPRRRGEGTSKRMETALGRLHAQATHHSTDDVGATEKDAGQEEAVAAGIGSQVMGGTETNGIDGAISRKRRKRRIVTAAAEEEEEVLDQDGDADEEEYVEKRKSRKPKKKRRGMP